MSAGPFDPASGQSRVQYLLDVAKFVEYDPADLKPATLVAFEEMGIGVPAPGSPMSGLMVLYQSMLYTDDKRAMVERQMVMHIARQIHQIAPLCCVRVNVP